MVTLLTHSAVYPALQNQLFDPALCLLSIWYFGTAIASVGCTRVVMFQSVPSPSRLCWCQIPVPQELSDQCVCVNHFLLGIDRECADLRREVAQGKTQLERQSEIASYVKATALKLTEVTTSRLRLPDELKKRILTTFLTLMNLQESLDRSANRATVIRELRPAIVPG